jgi:hypothetical protein
MKQQNTTIFRNFDEQKNYEKYTAIYQRQSAKISR